MPTVADLERLAALTGRLTPLGDAGQGELIRAEDWNTLVGAVVEIARTVLAEDRQAVPAAHEHADQVAVGWLDPRLRALIERGPLGDPAALARLSALEAKVDRLAERVEQVAAGVGQVRDRVTDVATKDLVRENDLINVRRSVEGMVDSRESVRELRETLGVLQKDVSTAVTVGQRLTVDGEPVDMAAVIGRLRGVEAIGERLTGPDGTVFDARTFENRLTALTNTLVTQEALDRALDTVRGGIGDIDLEAIEGNLRVQLLEQVDTSFATAREEIRAETNARLGEVDARIATGIANAQPGITTSVLNTVRPEIATAVQTQATATTSAIGQAVGGLRDELRADYTQQIGDVQLRLGETVQREFDRRLPEALGAIQGRVDDLARQVEPLAGNVKQLSTRVDGLATRIEEVDRNVIVRQGDLRTELIRELDRRETVRTTDLDQRFSRFDQTVSERITTSIANSRRTILDDARIVVREQVLAEVGATETRLRTDIATISRDAVAGLVRSEIDAGQPRIDPRVIDRRLGPL